MTTVGQQTASTSDYEQLGYDTAGNVTSRRIRDGSTIAFTYDTLNRVSEQDLPLAEPSITYQYDLIGRLTNATYGGNVVTFGYDALGRNTSESGPYGTIGHQYDLAGRRTRPTWADSFYVTYDYLVTGEMAAIRDPSTGSGGASSGAGVLATYAYDNLGRRTGIARGNGTTTAYGYDGASRLTSLAHDLAGSTNDLTHSFGYTPASQIAALTRSNTGYAWTGYVNVDRAYTNNGLNQVTQSGSVSLGHDSNGNITSAGTSSYVYNSRNLMTSGTGVTALQWDPLNRLYMVLVGTTETKFQYDGQRMIAEFDTAGAMLRRYVHGPGVDEPLVWYEGSGTSDRRWLHADERGSIVAVTDGTGAVMTNGINTYDSYGIPGANNLGRFGYTGQAWIPELGMWHYKARIYSPTLGRFMQPDPIGYGDGMNLYAYVRGDPVNARDPSGMNCTQTQRAQGHCEQPGEAINDIVVTASRYFSSLATGLRLSFPGISQSMGGGFGAGGGIGLTIPLPLDENEIVVTATQQRPPTRVGRGTVLPYPREADPRWPVPMRPNGCTGVPDVFPQSCNAHDICYVTIGVARSICDRQFYFNMLAERPDKSGLALDYYIGVVNIGDRFYQDSQRQARDFQRRFGQ